jgi:hypothetical protein
MPGAIAFHQVANLSHHYANVPLISWLVVALAALCYPPLIAPLSGAVCLVMPPPLVAPSLVGCHVVSYCVMLIHLLSHAIAPMPGAMLACHQAAVLLHHHVDVPLFFQLVVALAGALFSPSHHPSAW